MQKKIVLFGTGKYFENYMMCYGGEDKKRPVFAVDNDWFKTGTVHMGIEIKAPESLLEMNSDEFYVVICCARYQVIQEQLEKMGIYDFHYYKPVPMEQVETDQGKPYKIGYVPGVFDLFHIGHLNLLRNAKNRCDFLIAGVLTDELVYHFKKKNPVIPYAQRAAIVEAITYVDRVVPVDFSNTRKFDAWKRYHYDCHFSGNDHGADWTSDLKQLREVGSNMEFFEYTKETSSTKIRENFISL